MDFTIASWNIHGKRAITKTPFEKVAPALPSLGADILCLQEAHVAARHIPNLNPFHTWDHVLPAHKRNQNIIVSRFPVLSSGEVEFPRTIHWRLENTTWADIAIAGEVLRIYNCHFNVTATGPAVRVGQLRYLINHASIHSGPVVICGDFNTTLPRQPMKRMLSRLFHLQAGRYLYVDGVRVEGDERYILLPIAEEAGFREVTDITKSTWRIAPLDWELFNLKLDWMLVRGLKTPSVQLCPYITDHRAILASCVFE
jgi:endonuclease/exonuclease/phosphatase family metal-dependent hydrolase